MVFSCKGSSHYYGTIEKLEELLSSENYSKYVERSVRNSSKCEGCEIEGVCSGFCLGPIEKHFDSINAIVPNYCLLSKGIRKEL